MAVLQARLASLMRASLKPSSFILPRSPAFSLPTMSRFSTKSLGRPVQEAGRFQMFFNTERRLVQNLSRAGRKLFAGSLLGLSIVVGATNYIPNVAYAMDDDQPNVRDPSGVLKEDMHSLWAMAWKYRLLALLLTTVALGWTHPTILAINVAILLLCTRPNPLSVYLFIEQWQRRDMRRDPNFFKARWYDTKRVDVRDYRVLCLATVELSSTRLNLIGVLGEWFVLRSSPI